LIDIGLPGLDGFEVARRIRQSQQAWAKRAKLIALTGYGQPSDREKAIEAGFDLHLVKPVEPDALKELLDAGVQSPAVRQSTVPAPSKR
jgi:CheY-like chemotaxis protein